MIEHLAAELLLSTSRRDTIFNKIMNCVAIYDCGYSTPCWLWQGSSSGDGRGGDYPRMTLDGQTVAVHKVMWTNENGFILGRKQLDHLCRQRMCVRPSHCELVTHKENQKRRDTANGIKRKPKRRKMNGHSNSKDRRTAPAHYEHLHRSP